MALNNLTPESIEPAVGNFADSRVQENISRILNLIPSSNVAGISSSLQTLEFFADKVRQEVIELKKSQAHYNFSDYNQRLSLLSAKEVQHILETRILRKDGMQTPLGEALEGYVNAILAHDNGELRQSMRQKIIAEFALEDLIFESEGYLNIPSDKPVTIRLEDLLPLSFGFEKTFVLDRLTKNISSLGDSNCSALNIVTPKRFQFSAQEWITIVQTIGESGIRILDISNNDLDKTFGNFDELIAFVKAAGDAGIRYLSLKQNGLITNNTSIEQILALLKTAGESGLLSLGLIDDIRKEWRKYSASDIFSIVKVSGESGLRSAYIMEYNLTSLLSKEDFIALIKLNGTSGITSLNLGGNKGISELLSQEGLIESIHVAAKNGMRYINFGHTNLAQNLTAEGLMQLVDIQSPSSLKSFNLSGNGLGYLLGTSDAWIRFIQLAGKSGIRSLNLSDNALDGLFTHHSFLEFLTVAASAGIRHLNLEDNGFGQMSEDLSDEIAEISQKFNMYLIID